MSKPKVRTGKSNSAGGVWVKHFDSECVKHRSYALKKSEKQNVKLDASAAAKNKIRLGELGRNSERLDKDNYIVEHKGFVSVGRSKRLAKKKAGWSEVYSSNIAIIYQRDGREAEIASKKLDVVRRDIKKIRQKYAKYHLDD